MSVWSHTAWHNGKSFIAKSIIFPHSDNTMLVVSLTRNRRHFRIDDVDGIMLQVRERQVFL